MQPKKKRNRVAPERRATVWGAEWACPACGATREDTKNDDPRVLSRCTGNPSHLVLPAYLPCRRAALRRVNLRFGLGVELVMMTRMTKIVRVRQPTELDLSDESEVDSFLEDLYQNDEGGGDWSLDASWGSEPGTHSVFDVEGKRN